MTEIQLICRDMGKSHIGMGEGKNQRAGNAGMASRELS